MVFKKRLNYGSSSHRIPAIPEVPKSARGKRSVRKKVGMCAFDLLATVAGNLLLEGQSSACPPVTVGTLNLSTTTRVIKQEQQVDNEKLLCSNSFDHQSNIEGRADSEVISGQQTANKLKDDPLMLSATTSGATSSLVKSVEVHCALVSAESLAVSNKGEVGSHFSANTEKWHAMSNSSGFMKPNEFKAEGNKAPLQAEHLLAPNVFDENVAKMYSSEGAMDLDTQLPFAASHRSSEVPLCRNNSHPGSYQKDAVGMELSVDKDDDENSSGCTDCSIPNRKTSLQKQIVDQKVRKPLVSKYWKVASRIMRQDQLCDYDLVSKSALRNKKMCYTRQRKQRGSFKRRKFVQRYSGLTSIGGLSTLCKQSCLKLEQCDFQENKPEAKGISAFASGKMSTYDTSDYHVKLRIKSFKVPELYIDIPETATVGLLKQTVMEAVTAILQGGLHVGVLLRGKKVKDDNKTLCQAGISQVDELDSVGFTLEPNSSKTPSLTCRDDPDSLGVTDDAELLARMPPGASAAVDQGASESTPQPVLTFCHESDHDSVHSPADSTLLDKSESDSRALVPVSLLNAETLAVVPMRKSQRSEVAQRRLRRPFTVAEVEALVQAVEKFGTGRWRDVKLRAFDNAKHRTYVDLKDKWKTLVHTAQISPQQRRGEPVPQELLDRVLAAHAFWSHQQTKLQVRLPPHQVEPLPAL